MRCKHGALAPVSGRTRVQGDLMPTVEGGEKLEEKMALDRSIHVSERTRKLLKDHRIVEGESYDSIISRVLGLHDATMNYDEAMGEFLAERKHRPTES